LFITENSPSKSKGALKGESSKICGVGFIEDGVHGPFINGDGCNELFENGDVVHELFVNGEPWYDDGTDPKES